MLKFVSFAVKTQLNVHDLNNEAVAGNVTDIRIMEFLDENGIRQEAPAVSGRMLKHWHYEGIKHQIMNGEYSSISLCAGCGAGEPIRPGVINNGNLSQNSSIIEEDAVNGCMVCDIHGYLIARPSATEGEVGVSARRNSRMMCSWLMPVLNKESVSKQVIHNRVSSDPGTMMPFNKSYASGVYAFVSVLDVDRIGLVESNLGSKKTYAVNDNNGRKDRIKVAIEAYRYLISGQMGASLSHAVPHANPLEILVAYSESGPLPFPVSPMYSDYITKTKGLMPDEACLLYWGDSEVPAGITKNDTIDKIFSTLLAKCDG